MGDYLLVILFTRIIAGICECIGKHMLYLFGNACEIVINKHSEISYHNFKKNKENAWDDR